MRGSRGVSRATYRQPRDALRPDAFTLEAIERWALEEARRMAEDCFRLTSFWYIDYVVQHVPGERKTRYTIRLAQAENYGVACGHVPALQDADHALVGEDSRKILEQRRFRDDLDRTALIDLIAGHVSAAAKHQVSVDQAFRDKYAFRAQLFADEAEIVVRRKGANAIKGGKPHVLVIGATASIVGALVTRGFLVSATDMCPDVVGRNLGGVTVCHWADNDTLIKVADLVIATGMTLPNRTLPALMELARTYNTSSMIWAITGRNLGHYYIDHGIDCVISDPSLFLLLPGPGSIGIWRREL